MYRSMKLKSSVRGAVSSLLLMLTAVSWSTVAFSVGSRSPASLTKNSVCKSNWRLASTKDDEATAEGENLSIEYCTGCRWMLRSAWLAQELLTTFEDELDSVTLIPSRPPAPGGIFKVKRNGEVVWDREEEGGFPESKELKQRVRDLIAPSYFLGHSDTEARQEAEEQSTTVEGSADEGEAASREAGEFSRIPYKGGVSPNIAITYCTGCRWLLRAGWFVQELLTTFDTELNSVTLIPSRPPAPGGMFVVELDGEVVWDRATMDGFPELKRLKQMIRDEIAPTHDLGHSDDEAHKLLKQQAEESPVENMNDDEASNMRKYFGVN